MRPHLFLPVAAGLVVSACSSSYGGLAENSSAVTIQSELPPPDPVALTTQDQTFLLGSLDTITVRVFGADNLATKGTIDSAGMFTMPLIGQVKAAGTTTAELSKTIADRLRGRYLKSPQVHVEIDEVRSRTITVDGAVMQPGVYPVVGKMTLMRAIATARGASDLAALNQVAVFRTINSRQNAALFSLKDIREGAYADPQVYPNDIIVVGENRTKRMLKDLAQSIPAFGVFTPLAR